MKLASNTELLLGNRSANSCTIRSSRACGRSRTAAESGGRTPRPSWPSQLGTRVAELAKPSETVDALVRGNFIMLVVACQLLRYDKIEFLQSGDLPKAVQSLLLEKYLVIVKWLNLPLARIAIVKQV